MTQTPNSNQPVSFQPLSQPGGTVVSSSLLIKGNGNTGAAVQNGDWRLVAPADDLLTQKRIADAWVTEDTIIP